MNFRFSPFGSEYAFRPAWNFWERLYVRFFGFIDLPGRLRARLILPEVLAHRPQTILDFGSGTGCYSFYLSRDPGINVCGVEMDSTRIRESDSILERLERKNLTFSADGQKVPLTQFPAHSFDLALAVEVLQYVSNVQKTLQGIYRVLKPGGHLLGHIPMLGYLRQTETILFGDEKIQSLLKEAGFEILKFIPTFGGSVGKLCSVYEHISRLKALVVLLFPFLLLASYTVKATAKNGDYRFFIARKPTGIEEREQRLLEEHPPISCLKRSDPQVKRSSRPIGRSSSASAPSSSEI